MKMASFRNYMTVSIRSARKEHLSSSHTTLVEMPSFSLRMEEEECVTAKNLKQADSPTCTKIEHTIPKVHSSTIYDLTNAPLPSQSTRCEHSEVTCYGSPVVHHSPEGKVCNSYMYFYGILKVCYNHQHTF